MPLRSRLFAASAALQACLVSDAAHVVPGARGEHVARIQSALVRLRFLETADVRRELGQYGPHTAAAVLAYKRRFKIINRRYQTQADNIVGRMTIASLDHAIWVLDGGNGPRRAASLPAPHPQSPPVNRNGSARSVAPIVRAAAPASAPAGAEAFEPPLSTLPLEVQEAVRRSNAAKTPDVLMLYPFLGGHEAPLPAKELSARFGGANAPATEILRALHARMVPFGIWRNVRIIVNVYQGRGSQGIFCEPFDHDAFLAQMTALTTGPVTQLDPNIVPLSFPLTDSKFCRDISNVHGARDSFREIVKQGPGLHICVTQPAERSTTPCDLHIDEVQQGQVCSNGYCLPLMNGQTIDHLRTVGPWLVQQAKEWFAKRF